MMKAFVVCLLAVATVTSARPGETYTDKYDGVDVDEVLNNRRLLVPYVKCILEQGKCAPDGKELKSHIQEALETYCEKCNEHQKAKTRQVIAHLINHEHDYWNDLTKKYDPQHKYTSKYEKELTVLKSSSSA